MKVVEIIREIETQVMQLPDFAQVIDFIRLREPMGAVSLSTLPGVKFERVKEEQLGIVEIDDSDKQLLETIRSGAVEASGRDLVSQDGFLTYGGRKVVAYIRDQRKEINEDEQN